MLLGGLWHGASWNFVIWGGLHGSYLVGYHAWTNGRPAGARVEPTVLRRLASMTLVYALVTFTWLFFRSHDLATTGAYLSGLFSLTLGNEGALIPVIVLALLTLAIDVPQALAENEHMLIDWPLLPRAAFVAGGLLLLLFSGNLGNEPFIYFQF
jgi:D-alanyl-lipoteichoic acid acyltransferase DltB (MBOAT superfamily)